MRAPWTITLLMLASPLVSASTTADASCGTCQAGYSCQAGTCVLDTARLTGNPLPNITSDNPGGPIKTTGMSATTDATSPGGTEMTGTTTTSTGETKSTSTSEEHSSSVASMTSQASSSSSLPASSASATPAASTSSGAASSPSLAENSWVAWGLAWAIGLPLVA